MQGLKYEILDSMTDGILVIDRDYRIVFANKAMCDMCGLEAEKVIRKKCYEILRRSLSPCAFGDKDCPHNVVFSTGKSVSVSLVFPLSDKGEGVFEIDASPVKDEKGNTIYMMAALKDVTRQRQVERELQESEEYLSTILDSIRLGVMIVDSETHKIVNVNSYAVEMIGASNEKILNKVCHGYICPAETGKCPITDLKQTIDFSERVLINAAGNSIPILKSVVPIMHNGRMYLVESFVDITNIKQAEQKISESEAFLSSILEGIGDGVVVVDRDFKIISANKGYCEQVKMSRNEITGKHCYEVSHHISKPCYENGEECSIKATFETGSSRRTMHTHYDKENKPVYIENISYPLKDTSGNIVFAIEVLTDVTRRFLLEQDLKNKVLPTFLWVHI